MATTDIGLGAAIREARKAKGISASALGEMLEPCVTHTAVYKWELGQTEPGISHMLQMRDILGLNLTQFFGEETRQHSEIETYLSRMSEKQRKAVLAVASAMVE